MKLWPHFWFKKFIFKAWNDETSFHKATDNTFHIIDPQIWTLHIFLYYVEVPFLNIQNFEMWRLFGKKKRFKDLKWYEHKLSFLIYHVTYQIKLLIPNVSIIVQKNISVVQDQANIDNTPNWGLKHMTSSGNLTTLHFDYFLRRVCRVLLCESTLLLSSLH